MIVLIVKIFLLLMHLRLDENLPQFFSGRKYLGLILKLFSRWRPPWTACRNNV